MYSIFCNQFFLTQAIIGGKDGMQSTQYMQQIRTSPSPSMGALVQGMKVLEVPLKTPVPSRRSTLDMLWEQHNDSGGGGVSLLHYDSTRGVQLQLDRHNFLRLMEANCVPSDFIEILSNNNGSTVLHLTTNMSPVLHQNEPSTGINPNFFHCP